MANIRKPNAKLHMFFIIPNKRRCLTYLVYNHTNILTINITNRIPRKGCGKAMASTSSHIWLKLDFYRSFIEWTYE